MNDLLNLRAKLQDTHAAMARLQEAVASSPNDLALALMLESLQRRQESLEAAFRRVAEIKQIEVCSYQLIQIHDDFSLAALGDTLKNFQNLLTTVFDAIRSGPKQKTKAAADVVEQSGLDFGYAFSGSLGFVFTIPNERLLLGESDLDKTIGVMFSMMRAKEQSQLVDFARKLGTSPIRRMYDWASTQARHSVSTDIKWRRGESIRNEILLQAVEAEHLCNLIDAASDAEGEEMTVLGELVGGDLVSLTFHLRFLNAEDMRGRISPKFSHPAELALRRTYKATVFKTTTVHFATESETVAYELLRLDPAD